MNPRRLTFQYQFTSFAGVGVAATAVHYALLIVLVQLGGLNPTISTALGALTGAIISYFLNYYYTFQSNRGHVASMVKFFIVASIGVVLNSICMSVGTEQLGFHYLITQVLATGLVLGWNFMVNRAWTFRRENG